MNPMDDTDDGWTRSADAWLALLGREGDFSRAQVLDAPMLDRVGGARRALDVGCGEGRFCRMMAARVPKVTGLDPTRALLDAARDRGGADFVEGRADNMPFGDGDFDLVVSYLSLIDIPDARAGLSEMVRVLCPGGRLLIANLQGWLTASQTKADGWTRDEDGAASMVIDRYFEAHAFRGAWRGMSILNWHRPLSWYMRELLGFGLELVHFDEPRAEGGPEADRYNRAPYLLMMEWRKPAALAAKPGE